MAGREKTFCLSSFLKTCSQRTPVLSPLSISTHRSAWDHWCTLLHHTSLLFWDGSCQPSFSTELRNTNPLMTSPPNPRPFPLQHHSKQFWNLSVTSSPDFHLPTALSFLFSPLGTAGPNIHSLLLLNIRILVFSKTFHLREYSPAFLQSDVIKRF